MSYPSQEAMFKQIHEDGWEEYLYMFNTWSVCNMYEGLPFKPLQDALEQERRAGE